MRTDQTNARPPRGRRAFSLLELTAVVALLGLMAAVAATRFGHDAFAVTGAEGFSRKLSLGLSLARRQAIAEGVNAAVTLERDGGVVTSWTIVRVGGSGDEATDAPVEVPKDVTVTASVDRWEFDFTGTLTAPSAGGTIRVDSPNWYWNIQTYPATGGVAVTRVANP